MAMVCTTLELIQYLGAKALDRNHEIKITDNIEEKNNKRFTVAILLQLECHILASIKDPAGVVCLWINTR